MTSAFDKNSKLSGFIKLSLLNANVALLEADKAGLSSLCAFIENEMINDKNKGYSFKHFSYLPQVGEDEIAPDSLDFYVERVDGYIEVPHKRGKRYSQYGILMNEADNYLIEPDSYIEIGQRDNLLINLSCNKSGFKSLCNILSLISDGKLKNFRLYPENKNSWGELIDESIEFIIVRKAE